MRRTALIALALVVGVSGSAEAHGLSAKYQRAYWHVVRLHGKRAAGRNIVTRGVKYPGHRARAASKVEKARSLRQLRRLAHPTALPVPPARPPAGVATASPLGGIAACIRAHESGGNYGAVDPSGTYRGAYQFDYGTFAAAGGHGDPAAASPAEQDAAFARWWPGHHPAWPVSGPACGG